MTVQTRQARWMPAVAFVGGAAFVFAGAWSGLVSFDVVTPAAPAADAGLRAYWQWFAGILPALLVGYAVLVVALTSLGLTAVLLAAVGGERTRRGATTATVAAGLVAAGALLWIVGCCERLGADRAVALLAVHDNPIEPTNSIAFTSAWVAAALELAGSVIAGTGLIALGLACRAPRALSIAAGVSLTLLGVSQYADLADASTWLRLSTGGVLLPWWLFAAGLSLRSHARVAVAAAD